MAEADNRVNYFKNNKVIRMGFNVFIPENLDVDKFLRKNPPRFNYVVDNFRYIIGLVSDLSARNTDYYESNKGYVNVNAQKLQNKIHDYRRYLDYLLEYEILSSDHTYINGEKSRGYKFYPPYQVPVKETTITKWSLILSHKKELAFEQEMQCSYLDKWIKDGLKINYELAMLAARKKFESDMAVKDPKALNRYNAARIGIYKIQHGIFYYKRDNHVFRYHSILTNIGKDIRNFISYKGQPLVSVDIKSSQPYLSCVLLNSDFYKELKGKGIFSVGNLPKNIKKRLNANYSDEEVDFDYQNSTTTYINDEYTYNTTIIDNIQQYLMVVGSSVKPMNKDFYLYKSLIREGKLYEYIRDKAPKYLKLRERDDAKKAMFFMMFSKPEDIDKYNGAFIRFFADLFPDVYIMFELFKLKDYALFPIILQTIESEIVINRACKRIAQERPRLFIATIHDSIVTTVGDEHYVEMVLSEELTKAIGFEPILVSEYWKPENSTFYGENASFTSSGIDFTESCFC